MKNAGIISSLTILFTGFLLLNFLDSWQLLGKPVPDKLKKASPVKSPIKPERNIPSVKDTSIKVNPVDSIRIIPLDSSAIKIDSSNVIIQDSVRTLQQPNKKPDIRYYRRFRQYILHKKLPVT